MDCSRLRTRFFIRSCTPVANLLKTRVIAFIALAVVLLAGLVWWVSDFSFKSRDDFFVDFGYTGPLQVGAPVRISGVSIGKVAQIRFIRESEKPTHADHPGLGQTLPPLVRVRLSIDHDVHAGLRGDLKVYVAMQGFIGESYVEVSPGTDMAALGSEAVVRGVDAPRLHVLMLQAGYALDIITKLLQQFLPDETLSADGIAPADNGARANDLFGAITDLVKGQTPKISALLDEHLALAGDLRVVVKRVREATENGQLNELLDNGNAVAVVLRRELPHILDRTQASLDDLQTLTSQLKGPAAQSPEIVGRINELTKQMQGTLADVQAMVHNVRRGDGTVGGFLNDPQIYDDVKELMRDLRRNPWKFFWRD